MNKTKQTKREVLDWFILGEIIGRFFGILEKLAPNLKIKKKK